MVTAAVILAGGWDSRPAAAQAPALAVLDPMFDLSATPKRPPLAALATLDSNDAREYYDVGLASIDTNQALASAAFYWASRLDPAWAEPYYDRWYILHRAEPRAIGDSLRTLVDSLFTLALVHDPYVDEQVGMQGRSNPRIAPWYFAYSGRRFDLASAELARVIRKYPDTMVLYVYRAKATYYLGQYDTAAAILKDALSRIEAKDTSRLYRRYISRAAIAYAMGVAYQQAHRDSAATAAFQETLTENLGFHMAHLHLASEALAARDTAMAISEARLAADIAPTDAPVQLFLGKTLLDHRNGADAIGPLRAAIVADPYYALPYYYMGQASELVHDMAGAIAGYRGYLARAKRRDILRESAEKALAALGGAAK